MSTTPTITISCKDPLCAKLIEDKYGDTFRAWFRRGTFDDDVILKRCQDVMLKEAKRQEWYDYDILEGRRRVAYKDGKPVFLAPTIEVSR